jgi:hypothetical protein
MDIICCGEKRYIFPGDQWTCLTCGKVHKNKQIRVEKIEPVFTGGF